MARGPKQTLIQFLQEVLFMAVKRPAREAEHSPPLTAELNNDGIIRPLPYINPWRGV